MVGVFAGKVSLLDSASGLVSALFSAEQDIYVQKNS